MKSNPLFNAVKSLVPSGALVELFESKLDLIGEKKHINKGCGFSICCFESHFSYCQAVSLFNRISEVLLSEKSVCLEMAAFSAVNNMEWEYTMEFFSYNYLCKIPKAGQKTWAQANEKKS